MKDNFFGNAGDNYEVPKSQGKYVKFEQGDNKFRILEKPIFGWEAWTTPDSENPNGKPVRFKFNEKPTDLRNFKGQNVKHFWAMPVWNFKLESVQVLEITQKTIQQAIESLARNEDWGSPLEYNITINQQGKDLETKYIVNPSPHTELKEEAVEAWKGVKEAGFNINNLFDGEDPFVENDDTALSPEDVPFDKQ